MGQYALIVKQPCCRFSTFVKINGVPREIRCPIRSNHVGELMEQGDFVKLYVRAIYDGAPTGAISKLLKKAEKPTFR